MVIRQHETVGEPREGSAPDALVRMRRVVTDLAQTLWAARTPGELMDTVVEIEALKSSLDALQLGVVRDLDDRDAAKVSGWASTQDFVTAVAGGHKGAGPAVVRLAGAVADQVLAPVGEALADGWLSTAKAQVIERAVATLPGDVDLRRRGVRFLLTEAAVLDASDLRKVARRLLSVVDPDGDERRDERALDRLERAAHRGRHLSVSDDQAGGAWIRGRCSAEDAALIKATLIPLAAPSPSARPTCDPMTCAARGCRHDGRDPRDHGARMLDALTEACRRLQTTDLLPETHAATPRLTVTMDLEDLRSRCGLGEAETGEQISASAVRRLCCDADVIPAVLGTTSEVLDVGRTRRLVTAPLWKAVVARDGHCRFGGCTRPPVMCHAHHVEHWLDGGVTSLDNLVLLCGHHHRLVHSGPWELRRGPGGQVSIDPPAAVRRMPRVLQDSGYAVSGAVGPGSEPGQPGVPG